MFEKYNFKTAPGVLVKNIYRASKIAFELSKLSSRVTYYKDSLSSL